jgi:hypothetical protein
MPIFKSVANINNLDYHAKRKTHYYFESEIIKEKIAEINERITNDCKNENTNDCEEHYNKQIKTLKDKLERSYRKYDSHTDKYKKMYQELARQGKSTTRNRGGKTKKQRKHKKRKTAKRQKRSS